MKVALKNPVMVNHTHHRDMEIDDKFVKFGEFNDLYDEMLDNPEIPDDAIYIEHGEGDKIDHTGTVGACRKFRKEMRAKLGLK